MRPEDYLLDASDNGDKSVCIFSFTQNADEFWLLGDVFYRGYYVTHDDDNARIGIAPSSVSEKEELVKTNFRPEQLLTGASYSRK